MNWSEYGESYHFKDLKPKIDELSQDQRDLWISQLDEVYKGDLEPINAIRKLFGYETKRIKETS